MGLPSRSVQIKEYIEDTWKVWLVAVCVVSFVVTAFTLLVLDIRRDLKERAETAFVEGVVKDIKHTSQNRVEVSFDDGNYMIFGIGTDLPQQKVFKIGKMNKIVYNRHGGTIWYVEQPDELAATR